MSISTPHLFDVYQEALCASEVHIPRTALVQMVRLVRLLDRLSRKPAYRALLAPQLPEVALFDPGHDAVMMCYDFHLTEGGPRLIEVNTNAGGGLLAYLACHPECHTLPDQLAPRLRQRLMESFAREMVLSSGGHSARPTGIAIVDENPPGQHLFGEMQAFATLFEDWGVPTFIVAPEALQADSTGVFFDGQRIDLVYNRHCDFYLNEPAMSGLRQAYLARAVCLTPNPHAYGLLADKRRLALWSDPDMAARLPLSSRDRALLRDTVPASVLLGNDNREQFWGERRNWVFKPVDRFGSRGVLLGEKISRKRFYELPANLTLVQRLVPPSLTEVADSGPMKTDLRLYAYRNRVLGLTARLYRGQVTNLRTPGGGFAPVVLA